MGQAQHSATTSNSNSHRPRRVAMGAAVTLLVASSGILGTEAKSSSSRLRPGRRRGLRGDCTVKNKAGCRRSEFCTLNAMEKCVSKPGTATTSAHTTSRCGGLGVNRCRRVSACQWHPGKGECELLVADSVGDSPNRSNDIGISLKSLDVPGACEADANGLGVGDGCEEGEYCRLNDGVCGALSLSQTGRGTCMVRSPLCTKALLPVCGCDGVTYSNSCMAHLAGMSVSYKRSCGELI